MVTFQNCCVDLLVRAMPKMRAASGRTCAKFAKICINDAGICCKIFTISTHSAANFAAFLQRFRFETRKTSAQLQCTSAPCCASKNPCVQRCEACDCANFSPENAQKFVANSLRGRRATHQQFGQCLCENMVTFQNCCVDLLVRAMPKMHAPSGRTCAKFCQNLHQ